MEIVEIEMTKNAPVEAANGQDGENTLSPQTPLVRGDDYGQWLESRKKSWRKARAERKRNAQESRYMESQKRVKEMRSGLDGLFAQQSDYLTSHQWNIVSLSETKSPGVYKAWVVVNGKSLGVNITVPRTFYVNSSLPQDDFLITRLGGMLVNKRPTNCDTVSNIYQFVLTEDIYLKQFTDIQAQLTSSPQVYDVYEAQIPPAWMLATSLGCVASVKSSSRSKNVGDGLSISDLQNVSVVADGYFKKETLCHSLLYHSEDPATGRAFLGLHIPSEKKCRIWIVNPARGGQKEITASILSKTWDESVALCISDMAEAVSSDAFDPDAPEYDVTFIKKKDAAVKEIRKDLRSIRYVLFLNRR
jgi:hypothetical protein